MVLVMSIGGWSAGVFGSYRRDDSWAVCAHFKVTLCSLHTQSAPISLSVYSCPTVTLLPLYSLSTPTRQRILRRKATEAVPYTLLYIVFSGAFRRLLPRLLYWLSYVFLTSLSQDSTFAMSIGRKGETDGCDNGNQPLPVDSFVN